MKSIIVAYDKKYGIGADNDLLWVRDLPADLANFKDTTMGCPIIMGYNTYRSLGRPLSGRRNIVVGWPGTECSEGFEVVDSLVKAFDLVSNDPKVFVIGGGAIYQEAIDMVDEIIATEVDAVFDNATVFFPTVDKNTWNEISRVSCAADSNNKYSYSFVVYRRN
jgi:dihydrofolate reductase